MKSINASQRLENGFYGKDQPSIANILRCNCGLCIANCRLNANTATDSSINP